MFPTLTQVAMYDQDGDLAVATFVGRITEVELACITACGLEGYRSQEKRKLLFWGQLVEKRKEANGGGW